MIKIIDENQECARNTLKGQAAKLGEVGGNEFYILDGDIWVIWIDGTVYRNDKPTVENPTGEVIELLVRHINRVEARLEDYKAAHKNGILPR